MKKNKILSMIAIILMMTSVILISMPNSSIKPVQAQVNTHGGSPDSGVYGTAEHLGPLPRSHTSYTIQTSSLHEHTRQPQ